MSEGQTTRHDSEKVDVLRMCRATKGGKEDAHSCRVEVGENGKVRQGGHVA